MGEGFSHPCLLLRSGGEALHQPARVLGMEALNARTLFVLSKVKRPKQDGFLIQFVVVFEALIDQLSPLGRRRLNGKTETGDGFVEGTPQKTFQRVHGSKGGRQRYMLVEFLFAD